MFIKKVKVKGYEYVNLVESFREDEKTKHRVLYNFGRSDLIRNNQMFINMVKKLCEIAEIGYTKSNVDEFDMSEAEFLNYGYLAYKQIWEMLGIRNCLENIQYKSKLEFDLNNTVFLMAVQHLISPKSKLGTYERQGKYYGFEDVKLHQMYRSLDKLAEYKEKIEDWLFFENYTKCGKKVDVVFYDVTTFAFESVQADDLKNFGFSKDCKFNEVQVVMGLLIDGDGQPVGFELFSGNTFDGKTMVKALENVKRRFGINRVVIVADRGLNSKGNLKLIKEAGYGYIVASKIRAMKQEIVTQILDENGYVEIISKPDENSKKPPNIFKYKILEYQNVFKDENGKLHTLNENLVLSYSEKRANKDRSDRQRLIDKANKLLEKPELIKSTQKRGGRKYLNELSKANSEYVLDDKKILEDSKFDGYYGIQTSEKNMSATDVIDAYHTLWKIEECFRIMKSTMEVRPIFHWTENRIRGHFVLAFVAFMTERKMEYLLRNSDVEFSVSKIQEALNSMQLAKVTVNGEQLFIKAKPLPLGNKIWSALKMKTPENLSNAQKLSEIFTLEKKPLWGQLSLF